jgi:adenine-specific DNA methylase
MIPKTCKRLAEVDFPIAVVSKHSVREKSIRHGHPSTLHLWWARRPLAACRAMLLALLLPDPCDPNCPEEFKIKARKLLPQLTGDVGLEDIALRKAILKFIGNFADWDNAGNPVFLEIGRGLVKAAYPEENPLVVDPFAGGGSIPLEALRLGCETFASDLNPVACLILKVMLEDIPRHGPELAEELRRAGSEIKKKVEQELAGLYPRDPDGATPIAYLWARTVKCESPNCGAEIPLVRSFWLCKKKNRKRALRYKIIKAVEGPPSVEFEIFEPKFDSEVAKGTVSRAKASCLCCGTILPPERVRAQLSEQRGGADVIFDQAGRRIGGARLLAVVTLRSGERGRHYRLPEERDYAAVKKAKERLTQVIEDWEQGGKQGLCPVPDEPTPVGGGSGAGRAFSIQKYGMFKWGDLFTSRQKLVISAICSLIKESNTKSHGHNVLAFFCTRLADKNASLVSWDSGRETIGHVFNRQALPIVWDFVESSITQNHDHIINNSLNILIGVVKNILLSTGSSYGQVEQADACFPPLPKDSASVWFTDPPYYDAVPYADLSDFFFVWLKRMLPGHHLLRDLFDPSNMLSPKRQEIVQDETKKDNGQIKDKVWFENTMAKAFREGCKILREDGIGSVVFAHKTTEGWEAFLSGMVQGGWTITGSWPIATERPGRLRSQDSAALATSVHLVCRPRPDDAPVGDWGEVLRELPQMVGNWMEYLQEQGVRGADLVFACIGPALEIFSRYSQVETAAGDEVKLAAYLEKVWEVVGRIALEQVLGTAEARARNSAAGALEEDSRLTALFLWTIQSTNDQYNNESDDEEKDDARVAFAKGYSLVFDVVRRFAQPLGIDLSRWENRIIKTEKGVVRLLPVKERARQLFGEEGTASAAEWVESAPQTDIQLVLFPELQRERSPKIRGRGRRKIAVDPSALENVSRDEVTTLDRVHAAMLLQAGGQTNALRALVKSEMERGPDFLRLANALSALYPTGSEEKRLLDAMLLAIPR